MVRELAYLKFWLFQDSPQERNRLDSGGCSMVGFPSPRVGSRARLFEEFDQESCLDMKEAAQLAVLPVLVGFLRHKPDTLQYSVVACQGQISG